MIISYNKKSGKSSTGAVEYVLNERVQDGTAKTLRGNPELTKQLIKENSNKLKYRSGVIAFEGKKPSQEVINDIIEHFEKSTFAGLEKEQYNYLMVEHTDTDNYHIHFIIPRLELTSRKAYNPHYHKQDQTRLLKVQEYLNAKHNLSSAFSAEKRQLLRVNTKEKNSTVKKEIHQVVLDNIKQGHIQNANELKQFFIDSGATVSRHGKDYITVQFGTEKHKLKGEIYGKSFTTIDSIKETIRATEREHIPTTQAELRELKQELDRLMEFKAQTNRDKYPKREQDYDRERGLRTRAVEEKQVVQVHRHSHSELDHRSIVYGVDSKNVSIRAKERQARRADNHHVGKEINDRVRENIKRRIERSRAEREELFKSITRTAESLREQFTRDSQVIRAITIPKLRELLPQTGDYEERLYRENAELIRTNQRNIRARSEFRREREKLSRATQRLTEASLDYWREFERVKRNIVKLNEITQKIPLNYQQKIFVSHYKNLSTNTDFKGFYIKDNIDNFQIQSKKLGINIKDYGDKITAVNTKNTQLQVKLMLDIAESKGWNLMQLTVKGSDKFKEVAQLEIEKRVELQRQQAQQQRSRGYSL